MANELATRIRQLTNDKIDFINDEAEAKVKSLTENTLTLDELGDKFTEISGEDVDQNDIANALVDLADIFDDSEMTEPKRAQLDSVVDRLLKSGTPEQKQAAKALFSGVLNYGLDVKGVNEYFNTLLATDPDEA